MKTSVQLLDDGKVKLSVEIPAGDFDEAVDDAFRKLAQEVKLPGFRPGKVPRKLLEQRLGPGAAREQALRDALPGYYAEAVLSEGVDAIAAPDIEITAGQDSGDVAFEAVVEVRPHVQVDGYDGMRVVLDDPGVPPDAVSAQIDGLRDRFADLEPTAEALSDGLYAQIDLKGFSGDELVEGLSASDFLYEVGSGDVLPALDEHLRGASPGAILEFTETLPEGFGERAGESVQFRVLVKEVKRKVLPALSDEWVRDASEFETVAELEEDVRRRLETVHRFQLQVDLRDRLLEMLAGLVNVEVPEPLVAEETQRRVHDLLHRLESRGASFEQYLAASGLDQEQFLARIRDGATRAVKADLALRSIVEQEQISVGPEDLDAEVARIAERVGKPPEEVRAELEHGGGLEAVRSEVARGKALQFVVDHALVVDGAGNEIDLSFPDAPKSGSGGGDEDAGGTVETGVRPEGSPPEGSREDDAREAGGTPS